ncbi:MAG: hypothetical protein IKZ88_06640 [Neisseriaceae bacterium]|nr:hypothetical protein [Neisseriaceae bacterium]
MQWYQDYDFILKIFEQGWQVDETSFYFTSDSKETEHYIGYLPEYAEPYWAGYCDIPEGIAFKSAKELFEAKIFDGQSIKERWAELVFYQIGGFCVDDLDKLRFEDNRYSSEMIRSTPQPINKG